MDATYTGSLAGEAEMCNGQANRLQGHQEVDCATTEGGAGTRVEKS
jgi:hypothetical protein